VQYAEVLGDGAIGYRPCDSVGAGQLATPPKMAVTAMRGTARPRPTAALMPVVDIRLEAFAGVETTAWVRPPTVLTFALASIPRFRQGIIEAAERKISAASDATAGG
jgi:hypothetical protein